MQGWAGELWCASGDHVAVYACVCVCVTKPGGHLQPPPRQGHRAAHRPYRRLSQPPVSLQLPVRLRRPEARSGRQGHADPTTSARRSWHAWRAWWWSGRGDHASAALQATDAATQPNHTGHPGTVQGGCGHGGQAGYHVQHPAHPRQHAGHRRRDELHGARVWPHAVHWPRHHHGRGGHAACAHVPPRLRRLRLCGLVLAPGLLDVSRPRGGKGIGERRDGVLSHDPWPWQV